MSEKKEEAPNLGSTEVEYRCPQCDSVVEKHAPQCVMCGAELDQYLFREQEIDALDEENVAVPNQSHESSNSAIEPEKEIDQKETVPPVFKSVMREKRSHSVMWLTFIIGFFTLLFSLLLLRDHDSELTLALVPTETPFPPTLTYTPTWTPFATGTEPPTATPESTDTPSPTDTPRPPRFHNVAAGETLFGLGLFYRISPGSIASGNEIPLNSQLQVGQQLLIPWPTATPPLESMVLQINGENIVADVTDCEIVTIQEGDSAYGLSAEKGVPAEAIVAVNRLTDESIQLLHPGDTLCVPQVIPGDRLPPTAGPLPSATSTSYPSGPSLLYPVHEAVIDPGDTTMTLQWVAVKDLQDNEWYMVEVRDVDAFDSLPYRAFTRDTAFRLPQSWRPKVTELREMVWKVSIVQVTGERDDGQFIYTYGGGASESGVFYWEGAEPTATPTSTPTATSTITATLTP